MSTKQFGTGGGIQPEKTAPQKKQEDLVGLSRIPFINKFHTIWESIVKPPPLYNMQGLVPQNKFTWFLKNLASLWTGHYPYQEYKKPNENNGIFKMPENTDREITIALLSDWATDTIQSRNIGQLARNHDYSIHLGDTYYVGNSKEIGRNFNRDLAFWPYGSSCSFAMLGNHEMYSGGKSYFTELLKEMGIRSQKQEASFFCLENEHWRILGLDTGYTSLKGLFGISTNTGLQLHPLQMKWLKEQVKIDDNNKGIIFLSHHQCVSAFEEDEFQAIVTQLSPFIRPGRSVLWFWGHEHRLALYGHNLLGGKINCFARCIGNSGMPVEFAKPIQERINPKKSENRHLVLYDNRVRNRINDGKIPLGHNGYVIMRFMGKDLTVEYFDDSEKYKGPIIEEKWGIDSRGSVTGIYIKDNTEDRPEEDRLIHSITDINLAINKLGKL